MHQLLMNGSCISHQKDCSGINGTDNTIHHISISSQSDFTASMAKA